MPDDQPAASDEAPAPVLPALRFGAGILAAGMLGELALRAILGRMPSGQADIAGMFGFWFLAAVLVVAMRMRPKRRR